MEVKYFRTDGVELIRTFKMAFKNGQHLHTQAGRLALPVATGRMMES